LRTTVGIIPPTTGRVRIANHDLLADPLCERPEAAWPRGSAAAGHAQNSEQPDRSSFVAPLQAMLANAGSRPAHPAQRVGHNML
jgi:hypothetical protein